MEKDAVGIKITAFEPDISEVPSGEIVNLRVQVKNVGDFKAENIEAELFRTSDFVVKSPVGGKHSFDSLNAPDVIAGIAGEVNEKYFQLGASTLLDKNQEVVHDVGVKVSFNYQANGRADFPVLSRETYKEYQQKGKLPEPSYESSIAPVNLKFHVPDVILATQPFTVRLDLTKSVAGYVESSPTKELGELDSITFTYDKSLIEPDPDYLGACEFCKGTPDINTGECEVSADDAKLWQDGTRSLSCDFVVLAEKQADLEEDYPFLTANAIYRFVVEKTTPIKVIGVSGATPILPPTPVCNNNGACDAGETKDSCPDDCKVDEVTGTCGDGVCEPTEDNCDVCPEDCVDVDEICCAATEIQTGDCCGDGDCQDGVCTNYKCQAVQTGTLSFTTPLPTEQVADTDIILKWTAPADSETSISCLMPPKGLDTKASCKATNCDGKFTLTEEGIYVCYLRSESEVIEFRITITPSGAPETPMCPDGFCSGDETLASCPADCAECGDGLCNDDETPETCCKDCRSCDTGEVCNDVTNLCEASSDETPTPSDATEIETSKLEFGSYALRMLGRADKLSEKAYMSAKMSLLSPYPLRWTCENTLPDCRNSKLVCTGPDPAEFKCNVETDADAAAEGKTMCKVDAKFEKSVLFDYCKIVLEFTENREEKQYVRTFSLSEDDDVPAQVLVKT